MKNQIKLVLLPLVFVSTSNWYILSTKTETINTKTIGVVSIWRRCFLIYTLFPKDTCLFLFSQSPFRYLNKLKLSSKGKLSMFLKLYFFLCGDVIRFKISLKKSFYCSFQIQNKWSFKIFVSQNLITEKFSWWLLVSWTLLLLELKM